MLHMYPSVHYIGYGSTAARHPKLRLSWCVSQFNSIPFPWEKENGLNIWVEVKLIPWKFYMWLEKISLECPIQHPCRQSKARASWPKSRMCDVRSVFYQCTMFNRPWGNNILTLVSLRKTLIKSVIQIMIFWMVIVRVSLPQGAIVNTVETGFNTPLINSECVGYGKDIYLFFVGLGWSVKC